MNSHALFVYKDDLAYTMNPGKPAMIVPFSEIAKVELGFIDKQSVAQVHQTNPQSAVKQSSSKNVQAAKEL